MMFIPAIYLKYTMEWRFYKYRINKTRQFTSGKCDFSLETISTTWIKQI